MFSGGRDIIGNLTGGLHKNVHLKGSVVLMRKNALDFNDFGAAAMDSVTEFLGRGVTCQLISSTVVDSSEHSIPLNSLDRPADMQYALCDMFTLVTIYVCVQTTGTAGRWARRRAWSNGSRACH
jgi:hypothetical protein